MQRELSDHNLTHPAVSVAHNVYTFLQSIEALTIEGINLYSFIANYKSGNTRYIGIDLYIVGRHSSRNILPSIEEVVVLPSSM